MYIFHVHMYIFYWRINVQNKIVLFFVKSFFLVLKCFRNEISDLQTQYIIWTDSELYIFESVLGNSNFRFIQLNLSNLNWVRIFLFYYQIPIQYTKLKQVFKIKNWLTKFSNKVYTDVNNFCDEFYMYLNGKFISITPVKIKKSSKIKFKSYFSNNNFYIEIKLLQINN